MPRTRDIERLQSEMEDLFSDLWRSPRLTASRSGFRPAVDAYYSEDPARITVIVELEVLAAQRAGLETVVLPRENEPDLAELPDEVREGQRFVLADSVEEVLEAAVDERAARARRLMPAADRAAAQA